VTWPPGDIESVKVMSDALLSAVLSIVADAEDQPAWVEERISGIAAEGQALRRLVTETIVAVTGLPCTVGEYLGSVSVQREILRIVSGASLVLAEISGNSPNVYIEIRAARATEVPVMLLRSGPTSWPANFHAP
jgi:hypothetical protein